MTNPHSLEVPKEATKFQRMMLLFETLSELPESEREDYLQQHCLDDETRLRLVQMLANLEQTQCFLDDSILSSVVLEQEVKASDWIGKQLDEFKITKVLGEGGMGVVLKATQEEPVHRDVAIKMVHSGAPTEFIRRFQIEQATLAKLNHPNIATIYSVGETEQHQPYIVMEYIVGMPLLEYCQQQQLSVEDRLGLFIQVCEGIAFSHQRGVLHRDIKPANILVRPLDTGPIVKVIDFGIASDTENTDKDKSHMGTFEFMSPEHLDDASNIDIRADIFSQGMLLLSMLVAKPKFDRTCMTGETVREIKSWLQHSKPDSISGYANSLPTDTKRQLANECSLTEAKWLSQFCVELDWIYQKATSMEPSERYSSSAELAQDVRRYLNNYPLISAPNNKGYRYKKYIQRNKLFSGSVLAILTLLCGFSVNTFVQNKQISEQYLRAEEASAQAIAAKILAEEEQEIAEQTSDLMAHMFASLDKYRNSTQAKTPMEALQMAYEDIQEDEEVNPRVRYRFMLELAMLFIQFEQLQDARKILQQVIDRPDAPNVNIDIMANTRMVLTYFNASIGKEMEQAYLYADTAYRLLKENDVPLKFQFEVIASLGVSSQILGEKNKLEKYSKEAWEISKELWGADSISAAYEQNQYVYSLYFNEKFDQAETMLLQMLNEYEELFENDDDVVVQAKNYMTYIWSALEKNPEQNLEYVNEVVDATKEAFGELSTNYMVTLHSKANTHHILGQYDEAIASFHEMIEIIELANLPRDEMHHETSELIAASYLGAEQFDEAERWLQRWFTEAQQHSEARQSNHLWIELLLRQNKVDEALKHKDLLLAEIAAGQYSRRQVVFHSFVTLAVLAIYVGDLEDAQRLIFRATDSVQTHYSGKLSRDYLMGAIDSYLRYKKQPNGAHRADFEANYQRYKASDYAYAFYIQKLSEYREDINVTEL